MDIQLQFRKHDLMNNTWVLEIRSALHVLGTSLLIQKPDTIRNSFGRIAKRERFGIEPQNYIK